MERTGRPQPTENDAPFEPESGPPPLTRRTFLSGASKKALYVTPAVLTLTSSQARAGSVFDSTCGDVDSPCTADVECCSLMCVGAVVMTCS